MKNLEELMEVSPEIPLIQDPKRHSCKKSVDNFEGKEKFSSIKHLCICAQNSKDKYS